MRPIVRYIIRLVSFTILFGYLPLLALSYFVEPETTEIDIFPVQHRGDQSSLGIYGYRLQNSRSPKLVLLGASGVMHGMRPSDFEIEFPGHQAVNLAVSGTNISGIYQMLDAAHNTIPSELLKDSTFLIGGFFGTFIENRVRYGRFRKDKKEIPDCYEEIVKFGFYKYDNKTVRPRYSPWVWTLGAQLQRPFGVFADLILLDSGFFSRALSKVLTFPDRVISAAQATEDRSSSENSMIENALTDTQKAAVQFWPKFMDRPDGTLGDEQFQELMHLKAYATERQIDVIFVDLPIANWHLENAVLYKDYQQRKKAYFATAFDSPNFRYLNLQDLSDNSYFSDSVHILQAHTKVWARAIRERWNGTGEYR